MPICEFLCAKGHKIEKIILSMAAAEKTNSINCHCGEKAYKQLSIPFPAHLHGSPEGWYKPSPAAKRTFNPDSISYSGDGYVKKTKA